MARQVGIIKIKGKIGDISFYQTKDGFLVREKGGVSGERIKSDPSFERTRENGAEFGRAGRASKVLRKSLRELLMLASDPRITSRLTKEMMRVLKADTTSARGSRTVDKGGLALLTGFEFNIDGQVNQSFFAPYVPTVDRAGGTLSISIPPFVPGNMIKAPAGATHYRLLSGGSEVNFDTGEYLSNVSNTEELPLNHVETASIVLESLVTPGSTKSLFLVFGIEFYQQVNGQQYSLNNGAYNGLVLVQVSSSQN